MPLTKIGKCKDAFEITNRATVLGFHFYVARGQVSTGDQFTITCVKDGVEIGQYEGYYGIILSGKKHRRDMELFSLNLKENAIKNQIIGSNVYLASFFLKGTR